MAKEYTVAEIAQALNDDPERFAPQIIGEEPNKALSSKRELRFYPKGGLVVKLTGKRGNFQSFNGDGAFGDMLDLIRYIHSMPLAEAIQEAKRLLGIADGGELRMRPRKSKEEIEKEAAEDEKKRIRTARFLWSLADSAIGSEGLGYLSGRGITADLPKHCVRFRRLDATALEKMEIDPAAFPNGLQSLIFRATDAAGNTVAVQQIILDGPKKAEVKHVKRSNGLMTSAAVKLAEPEEDLCLAEGPETGASVWQATRLPTWIVLGTGNLTRADVPDQVKRLWIAVDLEESRNGLAGALKAATYWMSRGKEVRLAIPSIEGDFNDVLQRLGEAGVRADFERALTPARNYYVDTAGRLLPDMAGALPAIVVKSAEDALTVWLATGLPSIATLKDAKFIDRYLPEGTTRALIVLTGQAPCPGIENPDIEVKVLRLSTELRGLAKAHGLAAVPAVLKLGAPLHLVQLPLLEELAAHRDGPVIVVSGRQAHAAAKSILPEHAVIGLSIKTAADKIDWSPLKGRAVIFAPANRAEEMEAARSAAARAQAAGAASVSLLNWPAIAPAVGGWRTLWARVPEGYDFRRLVQDGWTAEHGAALLELAEPIAGGRRAA